jgi:phage repressor protein C with HTH and peptisase S24 domain
MVKKSTTKRRQHRGNLLVQAMDEANINGPTLARLAKTTRQTISRLRQGKRGLSADWAEALAPHLGKPPEALMFGPRTAQAVGYVGAGAEVIPIDDHEPGGGLEEVDIPPGVPEDAVLVIVRGDSMYPRYFDNELLFYLRDQRDPGEFIGRECVVKLADGRMFVKVVRRGTNGSFNLESWNAPILENKAVEWAAPVLARVNRQRP